MRKSSKKKQRFSAKQQRIIWGVGIAVVAVLSVFLALKAVDSSGQVELVRFFDADDEISTVTIQGDEGFTIERDDNQWVVLDRLEATDQFAVSQGLTILNQLAGEKVSVKRKSVGLDFPRLAIRVDFADESYQRISLGHPDPTGEHYYVEIQDQDQSGIYLVDTMMIDYLPLKVIHYLDTALLPWSADQLESVKIDKQSESIHLTTNSPYPTEETRVNLSGWFIAEPYVHHHNMGYEIGKTFTETIQSLQMNELIEKGVTDWAAYGLDSSDFSIEFITADDQRKILIGDSESEQLSYARYEGVDEVFTIKNDLLATFEQSATDFHDGYVKIIALDNLSQLSIESEPLTVDIIVEKDEDDIYFKHDDKFLFEKGFREAYTAIAGLQEAGLSEGAIYGEPEVVFTFTIALEDGTKDVVLELVDYDEDHYAAFVDQKSDFLVEKTHVAQTLEVIEKILEY